MIIDDELLDELLKRAAESPRKRMNLDLRGTENDSSQRMLNGLLPGTEVPVHRHRTTVETVVLLRGHVTEIFYNDKMEPIVEELREKNLLVEDQGAQIVKLDDYNMPPAIILRSDGATLYMTRDLAAAKYRHDTYNFDKCLYVVAYQQDLHFKQLFKVMDLMGWDWAKGCEHVNFGMVSFEGQTLSTREGRIVYLEDLLNGLIGRFTKSGVRYKCAENYEKQGNF